MDTDLIIKIAAAIAAIAAGVPSIVNAITAYRHNRLLKRNFAKTSILFMIQEDQFNYEIFQKFPKNYMNIEAEYAIYHDNGGNGEVTEKVCDYFEWYQEIEKTVRKEKIHDKQTKSKRK